MGIMDTEKIYEGLGISREVWEYGQRTESRLKERFEEFDKNAEYNQMKVTGRCRRTGSVKAALIM